MALIKGKQLQDTSVSLTKLSGEGTVTITGTITTPSASLLVNTAPTQAYHAVNKEYVDSVATGLDVKKSVRAIYTESTLAAGGTPTITVTNTQGGVPFGINEIFDWIVLGTSSPIQPLVLDGTVINDGDRILVATREAGRQKINGIWVYQAGAFTRAEDADNQNPSGEVSGGMFTFVEEGNIYGDTGWVLSFPNGPVTNMFDPVSVPAGNTEIQFTQFSAAGVAEAGVGLSRTGTKFDVNYDNSSIGIDGSDRLYVKANGITNDMILNEYLTFGGDSGSGNVSLGGTLTIAGGSNGIDTSYSGGTLTINLDLSELSTVTSIADGDFIAGVTANGATGQKITFANLKTLIGAASQLAVAVEGGSSVSFDLDTDTLNFASGEGLTVTRSASTAGSADTLTVTVSNNALVVHQTTTTAAANSNVDITLVNNAAEIFSVAINGVMLRKSTNWVWPQGAANIVRILGLPYAIESSDDIEITYRVQ
jgi:hypothetical protein